MPSVTVFGVSLISTSAIAILYLLRSFDDKELATLLLSFSVWLSGVRIVSLLIARCIELPIYLIDRNGY